MLAACCPNHSPEGRTWAGGNYILSPHSYRHTLRDKLKASKLSRRTEVCGGRGCWHETLGQTRRAELPWAGRNKKRSEEEA